MKRLFLSYSVDGHTPERDFVRQLFERLRQQEIDPWVFESAAGAIATGVAIADACRRKIEQADIFVVFITDGALRSDYVDMEVSHALWEAGRRPLQIVPLLATWTLKREWPAAMAEAAAFKGMTLLPLSSAALEDVVMHICACVDVEYVPPQPGTPRLPLRQRLTKELRGLRSPTSLETGYFIDVLRKADLTAAAMEREDYKKARLLLDALLVDLELHFEITRPYYPRIVQGAILMAEAHAGGGSFAEVERHFSSIIAEHRTELDANAYAGRANARMALGRFEEALADYQSAEPLLESPDPALFYNMVRARVLGGLSVDRADIRRRHAALGNGIVTRVPGDLARLTSVVALAYAYASDASAALAAWRGISDMQAVLPELVSDVAHHLHRHACALHDRATLESAQSLLSKYVTGRSDLPAGSLLPLRQLCARVAFDLGDRRQARRALAALVDQFPAAPVVQLDAAMFALMDGDRPAARQLCAAVASLTDASQCTPPLSAREFNLALGHAFWLLGRRSDAAETFRRSEYPASMWYGTTMHDQFGIAR